MSLNEEIKSAINKSLPAEVGSVLKDRLVKAEKDEAEVISLRSQLDETRIRLKSVEGQLSTASSELSTLRSREANLVAREKAITELELTAKFEKEKTELTRDLFRTVFQNRTVREDSLTQRQSTYSNGPGQPSNHYWNAQPESKTVVES